MPEPRSRNLGSPDQIVEFENITVEQVDLGDITVGRITLQPGWRWYDARPAACRRRLVRGAARGRGALGPLRDHHPRRHEARVRNRRRVRDPARPRRLHDRRRAVRAGRVDGAAHVHRVQPHGDVGPHACHPPLHRHRGFDRDSHSNRGQGLARASSRPTTRPHAPRSSGTTGVEVNTTGDGLLAGSTGRRRRCVVPSAIRQTAEREGSRSARASTSAKWRSSAPTSAASRCTRRRGS